MGILLTKLLLFSILFLILAKSFLVLITMKKNLLIWILLSVFAANAFNQSLSFARENMVLKLDATHVTVVGEYVYKNNYNTPASQTTFFPLPISTSEIKMDSLSVFDVEENSYIMHTRKIPAGVFFMLNIHGMSQKTIRITYISDHDGKEIRYPVMTHIRYWNKPLHDGSYTVQVMDPTIVVDSLSIMPDATTGENSALVYKWRKWNFNPDRDLEIWFHTK
jgi:hypothetical protein